MVRALGTNMKTIMAAAAVIVLCSAASYAQDDPPYRVARLNYITGNVSMEPAGVDQWSPADLNRPFTIGDYLYADQSSRAELHLDVAVMRIGEQTSFGFLNLNDQAVQIKLTEGDMYIRLHDFGSNQTFEVDTPNAAVTLLRDGVYRFRVDPNGSMTFAVVRQGQAEITGGGQAFTLDSGNSAELSGTDQLAYDIQTAPDPDEFDQWCETRDAHEAHLASARYLPPTVIGYEDLDDYGTWQNAGEYGPVWYPQQVAAGWAPYHSGHWTWVEPWGWTWVDDQPWGFAPFHYGRWAYIGNRWGWCPGPIAIAGYRGPAVRPYYAPAMVAWFGGSHFGVGISLGGPSLGWVALGFGEVYTPPYVCSRPYFTNVNQYNTRIVNTVNITNVYNTVYVDHRVYNQTIVNARAPNAVMAMPQSSFATGAPVRQAGVVVKQVNATQLQSAALLTPAVAPTRQALLPNARPAPHPAAQVQQRVVVARSTPPPAPAPFAARQQYLQQHAGQPHDFAAMHQAVAPRQQTVQVKKVAAVQPVPVHPGQRVGNIAPAPRTTASTAAARPAQPNSQPQPPAQPQPNSQPRSQPQPPPANVHGLPPNLRQNQPAPNTETNPGARSAERTSRQEPNVEERTQPKPQAEPQNRPQQPAPSQERTQPRPQAEPQNRPAQPNVEERTQPRPQAEPQNRPSQPTQPRPQAEPQNRPVQPNVEERTQPRQQAEPQNRPQQPAASQERTQPRPQENVKPNTGYPVRNPEPKPEARPAERPEQHPQPAAKPAPEHKDTEHKDTQHKDQGR